MASFMESPRFPDDVSPGVTFGPEFVTVISSNRAGQENRNKERSRALGKGDCGHAVKSPAQLKVLLNFFRSVAGRYSGFRFKDWSDYDLVDADSTFTLVAGTVNAYQLCKVYSAFAGFSETRKLKKPVVGTFVLKDSAVTVTAGAGAGQYALDTTTGVVTLVSSQSRGVSAHVVGSAHKFTLNSAFSPVVSVGQKVAISGVTGTAASILNGLLHTVTIVSGADVTVSTNTTGLTAAGGNMDLYRQQLTLTATCEFDVPCRFDTDTMATSVDSYQVFTWGQIPIVEVPL